jgi:hypothetical protein
MSTLSQEKEVKTTEAVELEVGDRSGHPDKIQMSGVYVIEEIPAKAPSVDVKNLNHLKGIPLPSGSVEVEILVGQDNSEALIPLEVRRGKSGEPFAMRTVLGWTVNGPVATADRQEIVSNPKNIRRSSIPSTEVALMEREKDKGKVK